MSNSRLFSFFFFKSLLPLEIKIKRLRDDPFVLTNTKEFSPTRFSHTRNTMGAMAYYTTCYLLTLWPQGANWIKFYCSY